MITNNIQHIVETLKQGDIVGIPTETVYGLGANGLDEIAVQKIFRVKGRPNKNPLILHTHSIKELKKLVKHIPKIAKKIADHYWPGPLTILFDKSELVSDLITAGSKKVAVRIPSHPLFLILPYSTSALMELRLAKVVHHLAYPNTIIHKKKHHPYLLVSFLN